MWIPEEINHLICMAKWDELNQAMLKHNLDSNHPLSIYVYFIRNQPIDDNRIIAVKSQERTSIGELAIGCYYLANEDIELAAQHFEAAIDLDSTDQNKFAYLQLHYVLNHRSDEMDINRSHRMLNKALSIDPDYPAAQLALAYTQVNHGEFHSALNTLETIYEDYGGYEEVLYAMGLANVLLQQFDEAIKCYEASLKLKPGYKLSLHGLAALYAYDLNNTLKALELLKDVDKDNDDLALIELKVHALSEAGKAKEALALNTDLAFREPFDETVAFNAAVHQLIYGQVSEADRIINHFPEALHGELVHTLLLQLHQKATTVGLTNWEMIKQEIVEGIDVEPWQEDWLQQFLEDTGHNLWVSNQNGKSS